jgi:hypothetical protein
MNLLLKNRSLSTNKNISLVKLDIRTPSKNHINLKKIIKEKYKASNYYRKKNDPLKKYEISKTGTDYFDSESRKKINKNKLNKILNKISRTIETKSFNNKHNYNRIKSICNSGFYENKINKAIHSINAFNSNFNDTVLKNKVINLKKRNSELDKEYPNLKILNGSSTKTPRFHKINSLNDHQTSPETFFTSVPIDSNSAKQFSNNSKKDSINSMISIIPNITMNKNYYGLIQLNELKNQIHNFEISKNFEPDEITIGKNLINIGKFINKKNNDKFDIKRKIKLNKEKKSKGVQSRRGVGSIPNIRTKLSKCINDAMNNLEVETEMNKNTVKDIKSNFNSEKTDRFFKNMLSGNDLWNTDINEYIKETALDYKKEIGDFTFYKGKGIYKNHLKNFIKNEKLMAFVFQNELKE